MGAYTGEYDMSMPQYEVVVPIGVKDVHRSIRCLESLKFLTPAPKRICIVTPNPQDIPVVDIGIEMVIFNDDDFLCVDRSIGFAPNWTFQQCIKLTQGFTETPFYMTIDSDTIFMRELPVFTSDGKPILWNLSFANFGDIYTKTMWDGWELKPTLPSMICHIMMFSKDVLKSLMDRFLLLHPKEEGVDFTRHFYQWAVLVQDKENNIAEPEIYANFVVQNFPDIYEIKQLIGCDVPNYEKVTFEKIDDWIKLFHDKYGDCDMVAIHQRTANGS